MIQQKIVLVVIWSNLKVNVRQIMEELIVSSNAIQQLVPQVMNVILVNFVIRIFAMLATTIMIA